MARKISLEFSKSEDIIYTARAGLVPINEIARKIRLPQAIDQACSGVRNESYIDYKSSQLVMFRVLGHMAGLHRTDQVLKSSELPFIAKLTEMDESTPVGTTFARFYEGFEESHVGNLQATNFNLATKNIMEKSGYQILVHDQSAIQKYGRKMEGVEKGYGGSLKRGSLMLQSSLIVDAGMHTVLRLDIRQGSTHSYFGAAAELDDVLKKLPKTKPGARLVLGDSAYGVGEYMRKCDEYNTNFTLAAKNDAWMKSELEALDFKRFNVGKDNPEYAYREFFADRDAWNGQGANQLFGDDWDGKRRVVVVRLPVKSVDDPKYQFLITSFSAEQHSAEEVHSIYRKNREAVELINDEIQDQLGLSELPSKNIDANRAVAQVIALAWNLQRHIEHVGMAAERNDEAIRRGKLNIPESRKIQHRFEWWTMFIRFITTGGRLKTGGNKLAVVIGQNAHMKQWLDSLLAFDWRAYSLMI